MAARLIPRGMPRFLCPLLIAGLLALCVVQAPALASPAAPISHAAHTAAQTATQTATQMPAKAQVPQPSAEAVEAGRRLFLTGAGRDQAELIGQISRGVDLSGAAAACVKCHGSDGGGSREAGLIAPSLRWEVLSRPRPASGNGFGRAAYSETSLLQAIRSGVDPSGRALSAAMPRFLLSPREAADLMAYLRVLGTHEDARPGVHPDRIVFGTALPLSGPQAARGQAVRQAIEACFARASRDGAVFGRTLSLEAIDAAGEHAVAELEALRARSIALVAPWWMRAELPDVMQPLRVGHQDWPVLAPLWPQPFGPGSWPGVYELQGQSIDQARVLIDAAASRMKPGATVGLVAGSAPRQQAALRAAREQTELYPTIHWVLVPAPRTANTAAAGAAPEAIVLLGGLDLLKDLPAADLPLFALSTELGRSAFQWPLEQRQRLWLAHAGPLGGEFDPSRLQGDFKAAGVALTEPALQAQAWAAACLGVEALRRAGRTPEGSALRRAMESVSRFETGVLPPISFSARHRQGIWGARMVILDQRGQGFEEVVPWNTPREAY
jgi:ABC-type branched-subunit amino acid transport system substrate-binding protein